MNGAWQIALWALWALGFCYFRYRAARAETRHDGKWLAAFLGMGWAKGATVDGRRYRGLAWAALLVGAAVFLSFPLRPCNG